MPKGTYELIASNTIVGSSTSSINFNDIPQYYTDLRIVAISKINDTNPYYVDVNVRFNSDQSSSYYVNGMYNFYGNFVPQATAGPDSRFSPNGSFGSSTSYTTVYVDVLNYSSSTTFKGAIIRWGGSGPAPLVYGNYQGVYASTTPITSINIFSSWIWTAGSYFSVSGIRSE